MNIFSGMPNIYAIDGNATNIQGEPPKYSDLDLDLPPQYEEIIKEPPVFDQSAPSTGRTS